MDPIVDQITKIRPPDVAPTDQQVARQRAALMAQIDECLKLSPPATRRRRRRVAGGVSAAGLALGLIGSGVAWAVAGSPTSAPPTHASSITITACTASGSNGTTITYMVQGRVCGPGHLVPSANVGPSGNSLKYCAVGGTVGETTKMIMVIGSADCPIGYVPTSRPSP